MFKFVKLRIPEVILIKPKVFSDERGFFMETYKKEEFENAGIKGDFIQDNHSRSTYGVLRGLHFQKKPFSQAKIIRCIRGVIYDVAVDIRKDSPTFGEYVGVILSENNKWELYIPHGFAHGFLVLSDEADVVYKVDNIYSPESEMGVLWSDPSINIKWPIDKPILSEKDKRWPKLSDINKEDLF